MDKCLKCDGELFTYKVDDLTFEICKKCGAVIVSKSTFEALCNKLDTPIVDLFNVQKAEGISESPVECGNCGVQLEKIYYNGVILDRCNSCQLLLFDNGELSKFFAKYSGQKPEIMNNAMFIKTYCIAQKKVNNNGEGKMDRTSTIQMQSKEKEYLAPATNGFVMIFVIFLVALFGAIFYFTPFLFFIGVIIHALCAFMLNGFITVKPQEAFVLTLFGNYVGSLKDSGFYWINPFITPIGGKLYGAVSLKARTLDNGRQKINDEQGNPIEVGIMVTWEVKDTAKAVFNVDNYVSFLSAQCDSALRRIIRQYPYDAPENSGKESLRGDSAEISEKLKYEIQSTVADAGLHIIDARITHLAYSSEIAAAMLQRQQANAIIEAKKAIVDGAVGMVEMALEKLSNNKNVTLDEATKANMVNNLLVVLCGNKESQPVIRNDLK